MFLNSSFEDKKYIIEMINRIIFIASVIGVILSSVCGKENIWQEESRYSSGRRNGIGVLLRTCRSQGPGNHGRSVCQQKCVDTLNGPVCSCWPGFRIGSDASSCLDINECSSGIVRCQHICKNTLGSYKCICRPGFIMQANGRTCVLRSSKQRMSESLRAGRHTTIPRSERLRWDHKKTLLEPDYYDLYEGRDDDSDDGIEDVYSPLRDYFGSTRDPYHWRSRPKHHRARMQPYGDFQYSSSPCQHCHQMCYWSSSGDDEVKCGCWHGYAIAEGSDVGCTDVDECSVHQNLCLNGACINTIGSFICRCRPGYLLVRNICVDINECAGIAGSQLCDHVCINTPGSYHCTCHSGYAISEEVAGIGPTSECIDIDECSLGSCSHLCSNYPGGFLCSCPDGMELHHDGRTCIALSVQDLENDFELNKHNEDQDNSSFFTVSEDVIGWHPPKKPHLNKFEHGFHSISKPHENLDHNCSAVCLNGGTCIDGVCHCPVGITGKVCQKDVNECLFLPPEIRCSHNCVNTFGSYLCSCPPGYYLNSDHRTCSSLGCLPFCMNGGTCDYSSGKCICPPGYTGVACDVDVDECENNSSGLICEHKCQNTPGSFHCLCFGRGKILGPDGRSCLTAPEFAVCSPSCHNGGTCQSISVGRNICICPLGSEGDHCQYDVDECARNPSLCGRLCVNSYGGYKCRCPPGQKTWMDENGVHIPCLSDVSSVPPTETSKSEVKQTYQFSYKEETQYLKNISSANSQSTDDHTLPPLEKEPAKDKQLKVLIEIIVSTVSSPGCNTSNSVYAPIYVAFPPRQVTNDSVERATVMQSMSALSSISINSTLNLNVSSIGHVKKEFPDVVNIVSPIHILPSSSHISSSTPTIISGSILVKNDENDASEDANISSTTVENVTTVLSSLTSQTSTHSNNTTHEDVWNSITPTLILDLSDKISNHSVINSNPLGELKNVSSNDRIVPSSVENMNDPLASGSFIAPNFNVSRSEASLSILSSETLSPNSVDETEIDLSTKMFLVEVPQNSTIDSLNLVNATEEGLIANHNENEITKIQVNDLLDNITQTEEKILKHQSLPMDRVLFEVNKAISSSSKVSQLFISPTVVKKDSQNSSNQEDLTKIDSLLSVTPRIVDEHVNQTTVSKESKKTGSKSEKQPGKKHKSKKGKKNRRKGRKVLKLNQDFEALNQVIHLPDNKDEDLNDHVDLLLEMKELEETTLGGRYFEILDYGDDDDDSESDPNKLVSFSTTKVSVIPTLPSPSALPKSTPPLGVIWKERPGESELECHYSGRKFPSRSTFFRDEKNCTQCVCKDGEIRCAPRHCPPLHCESPIEGDCCSYCHGDCVFEQQVFLPGERFSPQLDPCRECRCEKGGRAICQDVVCPPLDCDPEFRAIMPGECCPACLPPEPGCFHRGRFFYQGQLWVRQEGGCHACLCKKDGEVQCNPVVCVVNCQHPQFVTGECCPICDGCQYHNKKYSDQQIFPHPTDECSLCQCQQGNITCFPKPCTSNCSHPLKLTPNQCCPNCKDCLFDGQRMRNGSSIIISPDTCKECTCMSGEVTCKESSCVAECALENKTWPSGAEFSLGHDPCTVCRCWDGAITCKAITCPKGPASCTHGVLLPGSCCLRCEQCDYQGKLYNHLEEFQPNEDNCLRCSCNKGNVICEDSCTEENIS